MVNDVSGQPLPLLQSVARMLETASNENSGYEVLIDVLSLLCILSILNRSQGILVPSQITPNTTVTAASQPNALLQKALSDLNKSEGGPSPDMLTTLLPLLNNPQIKSKLNPSNIASILSMVNSLSSGGSEKHESNKHDLADKPAKENKSEITTESPAASLTATSQEVGEMQRRTGGQSLNWKHSF